MVRHDPGPEWGDAWTTVSRMLRQIGKKSKTLTDTYCDRHQLPGKTPKPRGIVRSRIPRLFSP
jgi:hypothetical protein